MFQTTLWSSNEVSVWPQQQRQAVRESSANDPLHPLHNHQIASEESNSKKYSTWFCSELVGVSIASLYTRESSLNVSTDSTKSLTRNSTPLTSNPSINLLTNARRVTSSTTAPPLSPVSSA